MVHPNNREFLPYDIAGTLDKQYVLAGYHSFVNYGQRISVFNSISQQHQLVFGHRLKQE